MGYGTTLSDVLVIPFALVIIGGLTYAEAFIRGKDKERLPSYRWFGAALIALALLKGGRTLWDLLNPSFDGVVYRSSLHGRKIIAAHYLSFLVPLGCLALTYYLEKWFKRYQNVRE